MGFVYTSVMAFSAVLGFRKVKARPVTAINKNNTPGKGPIYDITLKSLEGREVPLSDFKGKKLLIVNTASRCGFTEQLAELQQLHEEYNDKLVILGFPSEDFGGEKLNESQEIAQFCTRNYGVTFHLFEKSSVAGNNSNSLFKWLSNREENGWNDQQPNWNFCKYLVNENGELVNFFSSAVSPLSNKVKIALS
jgi:glutathione peroxidase